MATDISSMKRKYREAVKGEYPEELTIKLQKEADQKYGENPNQTCATYTVEEFEGRNASILAKLTNIRSVRDDQQGKGGLSLNNLFDITRGMETVKFSEQPATVIMKHVIPASFAVQTHGEPLVTLFRDTRDADRQSNFGGTFVLNRSLDRTTAEAMYELRGTSNFFVDVVAAPDYEEGVITYLQQQSKNIRIAQFSHLEKLPKYVGDDTYGLKDIKGMLTGRVGIQDYYLTSIRSAKDFILDPAVTTKDGTIHAITTQPTPEELSDLDLAWKINVAAVRSNGIVFVKNGRSVAIGAGQVERFGALVQAIVKGMQKYMDLQGITYDPLQGARAAIDAIAAGTMNNPFAGAVCSSDAFFPFPDSIKQLWRAGVKAVVQPYGSERDHEVIDAANKYHIAMPATLERCFVH
ncbi:MAG: hypothetical protein Q7R96_00630 [Nanoarchaeota archaeon]|nr:hypothetical protein [Nanoarchaeota archaeon]